MQKRLARRASDVRTPAGEPARTAAGGSRGPRAAVFAQLARCPGGWPRRAEVRPGRWIAVVAGLAWLMLAPALAQSGPTVSLNDNVLQSGGTVRLDASGLKADTTFTVTLTAPAGSSDRTTVRSNASGTLHFEKALPTPGTWTVRLSGPGIDAPFNVEVTQQPASGPQPSAPATPTPSQPTPSQPTPSQPTPSQPTPSQPTPSQPTPLVPSPSQPQAGGPIALSIEQGSLVARQGGQEAWRLDFPADSGQTAGVLETGGKVYLGHGNSLLVLDPASGRVQARFAVPAQVTDVTSASGRVSVTVTFTDGTQKTLDVGPDGIVGTVRFGSDTALFGWLQHEAQVSDPAKRLQQDPTNPWLYVAAAKQAGDAQSATMDYQDALNHAATFYERAQLARVLYGAGQADLAREAMDAALRDYVDRGYTAELLTDPQLRDAYGFALPELRAAVEHGDLQAASFWAPWVYRMSTPDVPATQDALLAYSRALRADGQRSEASLWRARAHEGDGFRLGRALRRAALGLGHAGWYGVAALLIAMVFLHFTLIAKYWRPQSLALKQRLEGGRSPGRVPRLFAIRYYGFTEKLVLVLMFAAVLALASLAGWANRGDHLPAAWRSGTLGSVPARNAMSSVLRTGPVSDFVRGYGAQVAGDTQSATQAYQAAGSYAPALNNLGVLESTDALYQQALDASRDLPAALYNLGRATDPSRLHTAYAANLPLLAVPSETLLRSAVAGSFQDALGAAFTNPWSELTGVNPLAVPNWLWDAFVVLFLAWAAITVVYLVTPRPRLARNAPRTAAYHLLALLIPGSGLGDELWGVLLLVPWAIFGIDTLLHLLPLGAPAGIPLGTDYAVLAVIYVLNVVSFLVELTSYQRRMAELRRSHPETARAYGMRVPSEPPE